jgi:hypothetical protein
VPEDDPVNQAPDPSAGPLSGSLPSPSASRVPEPRSETDPVDADSSDVRQRTVPRLARRLIILLGLLVIGLATGIWAVALFPSRPQVVAPASFIMALANEANVNNIFLTIIPEGQSAEDIEVSASTDAVSSRPGGFITLDFPEKVAVKKCPTGAYCKSASGRLGFVMVIPIAFGKNSITKEYTLIVGNAHFGFSSNGESAIADSPTVLGEGPARAGEILFVTYQVQGAATYDWSVPPFIETAGRVGWSEPLTVSSSSALSPEAQPSEVTGTNQAAEAQDTRDTFISGILLGVAGAAAIAAAQEGLHLLFDDRDDKRPRKLRRIRVQPE